MPFRAASSLFATLLVLVLLPCGRADDVPDAVRVHYDEAQQQLEAGNLKAAYKAISKGKAKSPPSADFWELYVAIYRGSGKKESTLWGKIIAKAEAKHPASPAFHILRSRLATDRGARIAHLEAARAMAPDAPEPPALLAREYVRYGDRESAKTLIDDVLSRDPAHEMALALRGDLLLLRGSARGALEYARAQLERHDYPLLHDLAARALLATGGQDVELLERAEQYARQAFRARPREWRFSLTLAEVLDRRGQAKEARTLVDKAYARTPAPELAAKRGEFAFREGDCVQAARGLGLHPRPDVRLLKALATCHARLGDAQGVRAALERLTVLQDDHDLRCWAAACELEAGDAGAVRRRLEGLEGRAVEALLLRAAAWDGDVDTAKRIGGRRAQGDSRAAEEWLLPIVEALLMEKLGARAGAARTLLLEGAATAARARVAPIAVPAEEPFVPTRTLGYLLRYATYRRCVDGAFFEPLDELGMHQRSFGDIISPTATVEARSRCERDRVRFFPFRPADEIREHDLQATMTAWLGEPARKRWVTALGGFAQGGTAIQRGDYRQAQEALTLALKQEPGWGRARLLRAVAGALEGSDVQGAARDAERACEALIDDWDGRTVGILVRLLAGQSVSAALKALAERRASFAARRLDAL